MTTRGSPRHVVQPRNLKVPYESITRADRLKEKAVAESGSQKILQDRARRLVSAPIGRPAGLGS